MDGQHFDALTRTLIGAGTRRGLFGLLVTLPGLRGLFALRAPVDGAAKGRRTRSVGSENHKRGGRRRKHKKHQKKHSKCKAESRAKTCAGKCGRIKNNCKKPVDCGDVCASGCPFSALQAAVDAANSGDTIRICAGTYLGADAIANIDKDLTIVGAGDGADPATQTILDADETALVLRIRSPRTVTLQGLRITGGVGSPGGVFNEGDLTMTGCTVTDNHAGTGGGSGGIFSDGTLTMTDCTVSENTTPAANAGGIRTTGSVLRLTRCTIEGNDGFAGGLVLSSSMATLTDTTVVGNRASSNGGGIHVSQGALTLIGSTVRDNTADSFGAGISNHNATVTLTDSSVSGNSPDNCGGTGTGTYIDPDGGCAP